MAGMRLLLLLLWILFPLPIAAFAQYPSAGPPAQPRPIAQPEPRPPQSGAADPSGIANSSATGDWSRVGALVHDQPIFVSAAGGRRLRCLFAGATDASLFCDPPLYRQYDGEYHVDRADVEKVRLDQSRRNMKIAIWSCMLAGAALGAADNHSVEQGAPRFVGGLAGAAVGALAGFFVSVPVALLVPGKLVYRHRAGARRAVYASPGE